jgi:hypothetical protein
MLIVEFARLPLVFRQDDDVVREFWLLSSGTKNTQQHHHLDEIP